MALLIVAPLEAAAPDARRIEAIRRRHDPHHALIPAHVTLVFGFDAVDAVVAARHLAQIAAAQGAIALRLSSFVAVRDGSGAQSHVFLIPDQGRAEIEDLHDRLYAGPLEGQLRRDIPYIPHVTVAALDHHDEAEDLARALGRIGAPGRLPALELIDFDGRTVTVLDRFPLLA